MIKSCGVPLLPFVRKAMLALEQFELAYENEPTFPGDQSPEFRAYTAPLLVNRLASEHANLPPGL